MCGIFYSSKSVGDDAIVSKFLEHRGTQKPQLLRTGACEVFGHSLLPVQGDAPVFQPMRDGDSTLVFAGELWSHEELASDTEFFFELLKKDTSWAGVKFAVASLDGMFAFVFKHGRAIYFASDVFGEMPLYYCYDEDDDWLVVATEIKQLIAAGCALRDIKSALPGMLYRFNADSFASGRYHDWDFKNDQSAWDRRELRDLIEASVAARVNANKMQKSALLLSGGLDSSIMAYELSKLGIKDCYTVAINEDAPDFENAEFICNLFNLTHHKVLVRADALDIDAAIAVTEVSNRSIVEEFTCHLALSNRLAEDGVHIVYTGAGADEIFVGYQHQLRHYGKENRAQMQRDFITKHHSLDLRATNKAFALNAIETRSPFLSRAIANYAGALDIDTLLIGEKRQMKLVLRKSYESVLGEMANNPKLIARETMGVKKHFADLYGEHSPYIYREKLKSLFSETEVLQWLIEKAKAIR